MEDIHSPATSAYEIIREQILHGGLHAGKRLRVAELRDEHGFGLTPIREALVRLAGEGLVSSTNNRGAWVRDVSVAELRDLMATRRTIERLCLKSAVACGDAAWEGEIVRSFHILSRSEKPTTSDDLQTAAQWENNHRQFHYSLVAACDSTWLLSFWETLADHSARYRKLLLFHYAQNSTGPRDHIPAHGAIMDMVLARNAEQAADLLDAHFSQTEAEIEKLF